MLLENIELLLDNSIPRIVELALNLSERYKTLYPLQSAHFTLSKSVQFEAAALSDYIHPPTFIAELEQQNNLLQSARDLLRAKQQGVELDPYFKSLLDALQTYKDSEFDDWCLEVDCTCIQLFEGEQAGSLSEHHSFEWEYSTYFNQGLTIEQAAQILRQHLVDTGWTT